LIYELDGTVPGPLNCTDFGNVSSLVFGVEDLADGDHLYNMYSQGTDARIAVDYFECVVPLLYSVPTIVR